MAATVLHAMRSIAAKTAGITAGIAPHAIGFVVRFSLLIAVLGALQGLAFAQTPAPVAGAFSLPSLFQDSKQLALNEPLRYTTSEPTRPHSPEVLSSLPASQWRIVQPGQALPTNPQQQVWLRLVLPASEAPQTWMLRIPRQSLQKATLYVRSISTNAWLAQSAGQDIAHSAWPLRSRDPVFQLTTRPDQAQLFLVKLEHRMAITEQVQLIQSQDFADGANQVGQLQGLIFGLFSLLALVSLVSTRINRSAHFAWFAVLVVSVMLTHLVTTGYMMVRIWPNSVFLMQTMPWVAPLLALAALARFAISASYAKEISPPVHIGLWVVIACSAVLVALVFTLPGSYAREPLNMFYALGLLSVLSALCWIAWRSQAWLWWIVASLVPACLSVALRLAYNMGWFSHIEWAMFTSVVTTSLSFLGIFSMLVIQQRERLSIARDMNAQEMIDRATGLNNERIAKARLPQIILRSNRFRQPCGAIMVRWVDMAAAVQQASVTDRGGMFSHLGHRLSRLARDIDTVARLGDDLFIS
ncbi:MAG: hypothetical protein HC858_03295 [Brachymonas sp.]|nr:hypothetical protein [Brachymonas sp.]